MITLERDGSLLRDGRGDCRKETIDLPAILVMHDDDMIDRIFDVVFERLGRCVVELRIRAEATYGRRAA